MRFFQIFLILKARYRYIVLSAAITMITAFVVAIAIPKSYKATTSLVLNYKGADPVTGFVLPAQLAPGYMATQLDILTSPGVASLVVDQLQLANASNENLGSLRSNAAASTIRQARITQLLKRLDVVPSRDSSVININFTASDPKFAAAAANAFGVAYRQVSIQLKLDPQKKAAAYFKAQMNELRNELEVSQKKVSTFRKENSLLSSDSRIDVEVDRLNDLSRQLVTVQGQLLDATARRLNSLGTNEVNSPDIVSNPLIQNLKVQLAQTQLKLAEMGEHLTKFHPRYAAVKSEVESLRNELMIQTRNISKSIVSSEDAFRQRGFELRKMFEVQKAKVIDLSLKRDELKLLNDDTDRIQRSYEASTQHFIQTNSEGQSNQADIAVLSPATPPLLPKSPGVTTTTGIGLLLGIVLGMGVAIVAEILDPRIRSGADIENYLSVPVFGVIGSHVSETHAANASKNLLSYRD